MFICLFISISIYIYICKYNYTIAYGFLAYLYKRVGVLDGRFHGLYVLVSPVHFYAVGQFHVALTIAITHFHFTHHFLTHIGALKSAARRFQWRSACPSTCLLSRRTGPGMATPNIPFRVLPHFADVLNLVIPAICQLHPQFVMLYTFPILGPAPAQTPPAANKRRQQ